MHLIFLLRQCPTHQISHQPLEERESRATPKRFAAHHMLRKSDGSPIYSSFCRLKVPWLLLRRLIDLEHLVLTWKFVGSTTTTLYYGSERRVWTDTRSPLHLFASSGTSFDEGAGI